MKKRLKPFNLKEALQGNVGVETKAGQPVTELTYFKTRTGPYKLVGIVEGLLKAYTDDGVFSILGNVSADDLQMYDEVQVCYCNVYKNTDGKLYVGNAYQSFKACIESINVTIGHSYIKTIEITEQISEDVSNDDDRYNELGQNDIDGLMRYVIKNLVNS